MVVTLLRMRGDSHIFNVILTPLHVLFAQRPRVQTPTRSKAMEEDEELVKKNGSKELFEYVSFSLVFFYV